MFWMAERISAEYKTTLSLNGDRLSVVSQRVRWSGDRKEPFGYWMHTKISFKGREVYREQKEITKEPTNYTELKHNQIVKTARKCARRGNSLEEVASAIKEIF